MKILKVLFVILGTLSVLLYFAYFFFVSPAMGSKPDKTRVSKFKTLKNYKIAEQIFVNEKENIVTHMRKRSFKWSKIFKFFKKHKDTVPTKKLPSIKPHLEEFTQAGKGLRVIWFGHSTFLLNIDGVLVLVDPIFSKAAAPVSFIVQRFQEPVLSLEELPKIDHIVISHDHYDHLDMESIKFFKDKDVTFILPLGVGSHLEQWGIDSSKVVEKNWGESVDFNGITFTATPAQHFSGRGLSDRNKTLWASWVIRSNNYKVYFSGDTGYSPHFKKIGDQYGPFDVAFIESGQYNTMWPEVHMPPTDGIKAYKDLRAKRYFPVHWGMFKLSTHAWYDPVEQLFNLSKENEINIVAPKLGEVVNFSEDYINEPWWRKK